MTTRRNDYTSTLKQMALMAIGYLRGRKLRTTLTTLAIVFGVALIFAFNIVLPSAMDAFQRSLMAASGSADLSVSSVTSEAFVPDKPLEIVAGVPGVKAVTGILRRQITLPAVGLKGSVGTAPQIELVGIDPTTALNVRDYVVSEGRFLEPGDTGSAVLPAGIADLAPELKVGVTFPLLTAGGLRSYTVVGLLAEQGSPTVPQIIIPLADAQAALNQPGLINTIDVAFVAGADRDAVTANVQQALGDSYAMNSTTTGLDALASMQIGYAIFTLLALISLFLGAFLIFNTFRTVVVERRHDIGMLRAIGATRRQITQMILVESLIQGIAGTLIGLLVGYGLALLIGNVFNRLVGQIGMKIELSITLSASAIIGATALGLLTALLAGLWPARAAGRVTPIEALRPSSPSDVRRAARWSLIAGGIILLLAVAMLVKGGEKGAAGGALVFLIGMVAIAPSLVMPMARLFSPLLTVWFAREGDLARGNLIRQPGRAAITASTLMIGLATLILMVSVINSLSALVSNMIERNFTSDLLLMPLSPNLYGSVVGADATLAERLRQLPEVETVSGIRYASSSYGGKTLQVLALDPVNYPKVASLEFTEGDESAYAHLAEGRNVIVNSLTAASFQLEVGKDFVMQTAEGPQTYQVIGIANDVMSFKLNTAFISQENLKHDFHKAEDIMLMVDLKPDADPQAALQSVDAVLEDYPQFNAEITGEYRDTLLGLTTGGIQLFYGLALVILIPAALGLLNTLTINVLERTREIGVVRAVGGSRRQVRRIVTAEALLLGLFGAATGVLAGIAMSYGFTAAFALVGWTMPYDFPTIGVIAAVIIGLLLALFASALPARNAAKLDIIRALQYE